MTRHLSIWRRWWLFWRVHRAQKSCQFPRVIADRFGDAGIIWLAAHATDCAGINLVLPMRPFGRPTPDRCTLLCEQHWHWALQHIRAATMVGLLDHDWHTDTLTES